MSCQFHMTKLRCTLGTLTGALFLCPFSFGHPSEEEWSRSRILSALSGLQVSVESSCSVEAIESSAWAGTQDSIAELHGGRLSPYDGIVFPNYHYVQIEHIVARKEADESGLCGMGETARSNFAADILNLTLAPGSLNASKGDRDFHDVQSAESSLFRDSLTDHALCWWAAQTVRVKSKHGLSVDSDEEAALRSVLNACADEHVFRPRLAQGADWSFRPEFVDALTGELEIAACYETVENPAALGASAMAVSSHLPNVACVPGDPRAGQKTAQTACIATLEASGYRANCENVGRYCPDVDPIQRGEPLYGLLRDADSDGVVCEGL
ncbi:MAG: DUF1524 domain-containing protein [Acidobacteriia bacterium]|nr:DUF1524 domain-containing protein [Terriglobia bacterium]MYG04288.1 DUF1524 domain-containing protein [Terriglobia bacterium]MYK09255.1 DUF1524 domain-containing protein [Terriglobia bacterium]